MNGIEGDAGGTAPTEQCTEMLIEKTQTVSFDTDFKILRALTGNTKCMLRRLEMNCSLLQQFCQCCKFLKNHETLPKHIKRGESRITDTWDDGNPDDNLQSAQLDGLLIGNFPN